MADRPLERVAHLAQLVVARRRTLGQQAKQA
jgi:hypothetical protein